MPVCTEFPLEIMYTCRLKTGGGRFRVSQFRFRRLSEDDWTREWQKIAKPCANTSNNLNPSPATRPPGSDSAMPPQSHWQPERRISAAESDRPGRRRLTQNTRQALLVPVLRLLVIQGPATVTVTEPEARRILSRRRPGTPTAAA